MIFRAAILQMHGSDKDKKKNTELTVSKIKQAAENGADILLLPECFITGYYFPIENSEALTDSDDCLAVICNAAKEHNTGVIATAFTRGNKKPRNSAFVISKNGEILMKYSKVHTCDFADESCLESGDEFNVCDFHGVKLGGYDLLRQGISRECKSIDVKRRRNYFSS